MNTLQFDGNLTRDPEITYTPGGLCVAKFTLANNYKKKDGTEETTFLDCTAFERRAEDMRILSKGSRIEIEGRIKQENWEGKDGTKKSKIVCYVSRLSVPVWIIKSEIEKAEWKPSQSSPPQQGGYNPANGANRTQTRQEPDYEDKNDYGEESVPF
ncbi:MAG: single-stranded DNA-binding protein [Victivallaceae bacterium]|nr:single-stranded DNA-binding protein [Victivallaceae bacterium]MDD4394221.1 single-stranded DNA-binding protein [Desulfobacterales bacterium]